MRVRGRGGFTLMETMISIAVLVTVAAVVVPNLNDALSQMRIDASRSSLIGLEEAVAAFREDINRYPGTLAQLSRPLDVADQDLEGSAFPPGLASKWSGPYIQRVVPLTGLPISIGLLENRLYCVHENGFPQLAFRIHGVRFSDALPLNDLLDGELDVSGLNAPYYVNSTGRLRWAAAPGQKEITLEFRTAAVC